MNWTMFWVENFRIGFVVTILYLMNVNLQKSTDKKIQDHHDKMDQEFTLLAAKLSALKGNKQK